ncbi:MAG: UvrB/UvrC motif-containing protein [bacterium]
MQIIGRAARNPDSEVILYADQRTESMIKALWETYRRRAIQVAFNVAHGITPEKAISNIKNLDVVKTDEDLQQDYHLMTRGKVKRLKRVTKKEREIIAKDLKIQLDEAIAKWEFEKAAEIRDQLKTLEEETMHPEIDI